MANNPETCELPNAVAGDVTFEKARDAYAKRSWWVSFFIRPCCPAPGADVASRQIERQRKLVREREDFTDEQKSELIRLIDEGERWYLSTPYGAKGPRA